MRCAAILQILATLDFFKASDACLKEKDNSISSSNYEGDMEGLCPLLEPVSGGEYIDGLLTATNTAIEELPASSSISSRSSLYSSSLSDTPTAAVISPPSEVTDTPSSSTGKMEESFNYASFDCGALIRASNKEATHSTSILQNSKDAYMLNPCSADKYVEIEVCQTILVKEITLANFEFFSSQFRDFSVYGSSKLPPDWILLGNYTAKNVRERQHFAIKDPKIWSKHVRIHFLSHFGVEFYCPLTSIQIFGTTMLDDPIISSPSIPVVSTTAAIEKISTTTSSAPGPTETVESVCLLPIVFTSDASTSTNRQSETESVIASQRGEATITVTPPPPISSPSAVAQQESVFAKIIHRIAQLEKTSSVLDGGFLNLQAFVNQSREDSFHLLKESESMLLIRIEEQVIDCLIIGSSFYFTR